MPRRQTKNQLENQDGGGGPPDGFWHPAGQPLPASLACLSRAGPAPTDTRSGALGRTTHQTHESGPVESEGAESNTQDPPVGAGPARERVALATRQDSRDADSSGVRCSVSETRCNGGAFRDRSSHPWPLSFGHPWPNRSLQAPPLPRSLCSGTATGQIHPFRGSARTFQFSKEPRALWRERSLGSCRPARPAFRGPGPLAQPRPAPRPCWREPPNQISRVSRKRMSGWRSWASCRLTRVGAR